MRLINKILLVVLIFMVACTTQTKDFEQEPEIIYKQITNFTCFTNKFEFGFTNLHENKTILSQELKFEINKLEVPCYGIQNIIKPLQPVQCNITQTIAENYTVEVFVEHTINNYNISFSCAVFYVEPIEFTSNTLGNETEINIIEFRKWAEERKISLVGIKKDANEVYYQGLNSSDIIDLEEVPYWWWAETGLRKIPDKVLKIMQDKTIYFSVKKGRGYALASDWLEGTTAGFILEQTITDNQAVHELGHLVDFTGTQGIYDDPLNIFSSVRDEKDKLFTGVEDYNPDAEEIPKGFISIYSSANNQEDFASHFAHYVLDAEEFRKKAETDKVLKKKYEFLKNKIFDSREY